MKNIAIFASGNGSNAENIIKYFKNSDLGQVKLVACNNSKAGVIERAEKAGIPVFLFSKSDLQEGKVTQELLKNQIDLIVLAGFLWMIPENLTRAFHNRIINIHPALLPKYGGSGMYGNKVHEAVINAGEAESGISIHFVNDKYDEGEIIFQAKCKISPSDTNEILAQKIHQLEHLHYPKVIEKLLK